MHGDNGHTAGQELRVLLFKDQGLWIAQCLDYDIAAQAQTLKDVKYEFERLLVGHIVASLDNHLVPFANTPRAPQMYWNMFEEAAETKLDIRGESEWPKFNLPASVLEDCLVPWRPSEVRVQV